jgi:5-methylcytosine-specific restriction endonuclease McrA
MTDVTSTPRGSMSPMRQLRIWEREKGICCLCGEKIDGTRRKNWIIEHKIPLGLGGSDTDDNCAPAHEGCRRVKDKTDVKAIAKAKRCKAKIGLGIRKRSIMAGSRDSKWKKPFNRPAELRHGR